MLKFTCCNPLREIGGQTRLLRSITRGFERECLRVNSIGQLASTDHPSALGSKLTHPWITTDYAEALLEFITPPSQDPAFPLTFLKDIHRYSAAQLGDELLWPGSMPGKIGADSTIAIADYGFSNQARFKMVYREGLGLRYGRAMQTIAGAHYNWSLGQDFWQALYACCPAGADLQNYINQRYFGLIRNFLRFGWLIPYLFGASPALCQSFLQGRPSDLQALGQGTLYGPYATSLRMSDLGYQNRAQDKLAISFNSLEQYCTALEGAIRSPDPYYSELGVRVGDHWQQISANILQLEAEFYAPIRPKRVSSLRPAKALREQGVEYLEVRLFDLNPFIDIGIAPEQSLFADALLLLCLFRDSPPISCREQSENDENKRRVVLRGRQPDLQLLLHNREQPMRPLAHQLFDDMEPFAELLDCAYGGQAYQQALQYLRQRIDQPENTPSAQVLAAVTEQQSYFDFALNLAHQHTRSLQREPLDDASLIKFTQSVSASRRAQRDIEAQDQLPFAEFVARYFE